MGGDGEEGDGGLIGCLCLEERGDLGLEEDEEEEDKDPKKKSLVECMVAWMMGRETSTPSPLPFTWFC